MELKGTLVLVTPTQQVTEKLTKRELILEYADNPNYPQMVKFEAVNDRCKVMDNMKPGDEIEVFFNIQGRKWTDKTGKDSYFNTLSVWKINKLSGGNTESAPQAGYSIGEMPDEDSLPF